MTIAAALIGLGQALLLGQALQNWLYAAGVPVAAAAAGFVMALYGLGRLQGCALYAGLQLAWMVLCLASGLFNYSAGGFASGLGSMMVFVFSIAAWPLLGALLGFCCAAWHDDHQQLAIQPLADHGVANPGVIE